MAPNYIFVHQSKKEELLKALEKWMGKIYGATSEERSQSTSIARKVNVHHFKRVKDLIDDAKAKGSQVLLGDNYNEADCYIEPTILVDTPEEAHIRKRRDFSVRSCKSSPTTTSTTSSNTSIPSPIHWACTSFPVPASSSIRSPRRPIPVLSPLTRPPCLSPTPTCPSAATASAASARRHGFAGFMAFTNEKAYLRQRVGFTTAKSFYPPFTNLKMKLIQFVVKYLS